LSTHKPVEFVAIAFITFDLWPSIAFCPSIEQTGTVIDGKLVKKHSALISLRQLKFFLLSLPTLAVRSGLR
jgi:hypothetical protein